MANWTALLDELDRAEKTYAQAKDLQKNLHADARLAHCETHGDFQQLHREMNAFGKTLTLETRCPECAAEA